MKPSLLLSHTALNEKTFVEGRAESHRIYNRDFSGAILHLSEIRKHMPGGIEVLF